MTYPKCQRCLDGELLPLSDEGRGGGEMRYKAWVCSNPKCNHVIRIDAGKVTKVELTEEDA
jgi:hypothetical protein